MIKLILALCHCLLVFLHFFKLLVLFVYKDRRITFIHFFSNIKDEHEADMPLGAYLLLEFLIERCHSCVAVLFVCLHFLIEFLLCHLAKVAVFINGLLDDLLLMLTLLSKVFQHFSLMALTK